MARVMKYDGISHQNVDIRAHFLMWIYSNALLLSSVFPWVYWNDSFDLRERESESR